MLETLKTSSMINFKLSLVKPAHQKWTLSVAFCPNAKYMYLNNFFKTEKHSLAPTFYMGNYTLN